MCPQVGAGSDNRPYIPVSASVFHRANSFFFDDWEVADMAAEGRPSRSRHDMALVDRSRGTPKLRNAVLEPAPSRVKRAHGAAGPIVSRFSRPSAMTQTELDDIYSLAPDDSCGEEGVKRRRVLTKARSDMGNGKAKATAPSASTVAAVVRPPRQPPNMSRSISDGCRPSFSHNRPESTGLDGAVANSREPDEVVQSSSGLARAGRASRTERPLPSGHDGPRPSSRGFGASVSSPAAEASTARLNSSNRTSKAGRVRLIDRLAAQVEEMERVSDSDMDVSLAAPIPGQHGMVTNASVKHNVSATPHRAGTTTGGRVTGQSTKKSNVKTYSQKRSIRADAGSQIGFGAPLQDSNGVLGFDSMTPSYQNNQPDLFAIDDEGLDDSRPRTGILGLHALRQAGANHRFANDLSDLFDRIGKPQSMGSSSARSRRIALLELGRRFHDKKFVSSFCDDPSHEAIFRDMGREYDVINGFVLLSALVFLLTRSSSPHLAIEVCEDGVDGLLHRMVRLDEDIVHISRQKQHNVSKNGRVSLDALKTTILQNSNIWGTVQPLDLTPRTIGLQALTLLCRHAGDSSSATMVTSFAPALLELVANGRAALESGDRGPGSIVDLWLALSLLQNYSTNAFKGGGSAGWLAACLPSVSSILSGAIHEQNPEVAEIELHALKLAMNLSNSPEAAAILGIDGLLRNLSQAAVTIFSDLHGNIRHGQLLESQYGRLVLILGVLVNVTEHHPPARCRFGSWTDDPSPFHQLIAVYMDNRESSGKVSRPPFSSLMPSAD